MILSVLDDGHYVDDALVMDCCIVDDDDRHLHVEKHQETTLLIDKNITLSVHTNT